MPVPPKPPDRRQRRNARGFEKRSLSLVPAPPAQQAPSAPAGLLPGTRKAWDLFFATPLAQQTVKVGTDLGAVSRLFSLYDERERCYRVVQKGRLVEGSMGQVVLNPLYRQMSVLDAEIRQLEDRFGLTPLARMKLGVQFGEAARSLEDLNRIATLSAEETAKPRRRRKASS